MEKEFNVTGNCNPKRHYMVDISNKLKAALRLIEKRKYFSINRPRQYGKTTILDELERRLEDKYILIYLSFAGIGDTIFRDEASFSSRFVEMLARSLDFSYPETAESIRNTANSVIDLETLSIFISQFVNKADSEVILLIDEVDKSSNNQLFVSFLAMLRQKYLLRERGKDVSFLSVILAGVHDVKSLKLILREGEETKLNSPWNIAADFNVDMSFNPTEIKTMLVSYAEDKDVKMDFDALAERIHYYTSGYPFLVSKLCKNIDEEEAAQNTVYNPKHWTLDDIDWSFRWVTRESYTTTNFDDLAKNLENNPSLYELTYRVIFGVDEQGIIFSALDPIVNMGCLYGLLSEKKGKVVVHNLIYEQLIANYMRSRKLTRDGGYPIKGALDNYLIDENLDINKILIKFQEFMKEHYSEKDAVFLEREGRLVFMSFLKPIVNGNGFMWKEPVTAEERRMDIVVTFGNSQKEVIELKIWRGEQYHQKGLLQLSDYLDFQGIKTGYLLIFNFNKNKEYRSEQIKFADKKIFAVYI